MIVFRPNGHAYMPGADIVNRPVVAAAASDWWLSGGIDAGDVVAVYQPKGAASLAASYTNLANPGTYDASPTGSISFDTASGWTFDGTQYLTTGITTTTLTIIIRVNKTGTGDDYFVGSSTSGGIGIRHKSFGKVEVLRQLQASEITSTSAATGDNVWGVVVGNGTDRIYLNGSLDKSDPAGGSYVSANLRIADGKDADQELAGVIAAIAFYSGERTGDQISAVSTAMAAL